MLTLTDGMLLYHGNFVQVSEIDLDKCKRGKDFGRGFYVTSSYKQAQNFVPLSVNKQVNEGRLLPGTTSGYISVFKLHLNPDIAVHLFDAADGDWLHFVAANRRKILFPNVREQYAGFDINGQKVTTICRFSVFQGRLHSSAISCGLITTFIYILFPLKVPAGINSAVSQNYG